MGEGRWRRRALLVCEGYATVGVQVALLRALLPHGGAGIPTTSVALTAMLIGLGTGYAAAGRGRTQGSERDAARCLMLAAAWAAVGLSPAVVGGVLYAGEAATGSPLAAAAVYAVLAGAPALHWLGRATAILIGLAHAGGSQRDAGQGLAWSCLGNAVAGTTVALITMRWLGTAAATATIVAACAGAALWAGWRDRGDRRGLCAAAGALAVLTGIDVAQTRGGDLRTTAYADYRRDRDPAGQRTLYANSQAMSGRDAQGRALPYVERIEDGLEQAGGGRVLVLGGGGLTLGEGRPRIEATFVDVEPDTREIAEWGVEAEAEPPLVVADARAALARLEARWPAVVADVFRGPRTRPGHLATREAWQAVHAVLEPQGLLVVNTLVDRADGRLSVYEARRERTLRSVFADCVRDEQVPGHRLYWCRRHPADGEGRIYADASTAAAIEGVRPLRIEGQEARGQEAARGENHGDDGAER